MTTRLETAPTAPRATIRPQPAKLGAVQKKGTARLSTTAPKPPV